MKEEEARRPAVHSRFSRRFAIRKAFICAVLITWSVALATAKAMTTWKRYAPSTQPVPSIAPTDAGVLRSLDRKVPEVAFAGNSLSDVIDFLGDVSGVSIVVKWRIVEATGIEGTRDVNLREQGVPLEKILRDVLTSASGARGKLGYVVRHGAVVVSTAEDLAIPPAELRLPRGNQADANAATEKLLDRALPLEPKPHDPLEDDLVFESQGNGLVELIDWFAKSMHAKIIVNWRALDAVGIKKDQPITMKIRTASVRQILSLLLESASGPKVRLEYAVVDGVVTISSKQDFDGQVVVRKYAAADLLQSPAFAPFGQGLVDRIRENVDPGSWDGPGKVEVAGWELVLKATPENQQKVGKLLEELRKRDR